MRLLLLCALLAGCSSTPTAVSDTAPVPTNRVLSQAYAKPGKDTGTAVLIRDKFMGGFACNWTMAVNGADIAELSPGESIVVYPPAGEVFVSTRPTALLCAGTVLETSFVLQPGKTRTIRHSADWQGTMRLQSSTY